jgi:hypothetical protein
MWNKFVGSRISTQPLKAASYRAGGRAAYNRYARVAVQTLEPRRLFSATHMVFLEQPTIGVQGQTLGTIQVALEDDSGNIVTSDQSVVSLSYPVPPSVPRLFGGSGNISLGSATAQNGIATFTGLSIDATGVFTLTANDGFLSTTDPTSLLITSNGPRLVFLTQPGSTAEGQPLGTIQVAIEDIHGNILTNEDTSVTLDVFPPSISRITTTTLTPDSQGTGVVTSLPGLVGTTTVSTQNGIAIFTDLSLDDPGTFSLLASVPIPRNSSLVPTDNSTAPLSVLSSDFTLSVVGRHIVFTSQPSNTLPGVVIQSFSVAVEDTFGNTFGDDTSSIALTAQAALGNPGGSPVAARWCGGH